MELNKYINLLWYLLTITVSSQKNNEIKSKEYLNELKARRT